MTSSIGLLHSHLRAGCQPRPACSWWLLLMVLATVTPANSYSLIGATLLDGMLLLQTPQGPGPLAYTARSCMLQTSLWQL